MLRTMAQESFDFYSLSALQIGWEFDATQLAHANEPSSARVIEGDRVSLVPMALNANFSQTLVSKPGYLNFGLPAVNSSPIWVGKQVVNADNLILFPNGEEGTSESVAGFNAIAIHLQQSHLEDLLQVVFHRTIDDLLAHTGANRLLACDQEFLRQELESWDSLALNPHQVTDAFLRTREDTLAESILSCWFRGYREGLGKQLKSQRAMNIALALIHEGPPGEVAVARLCEESGCCISTLEYSFSKHFGVTPKQYIKSLQLSRVRRDMYLFDEKGYRSITDVATKHGIWHMGQFAADYRRLFGELPSETLARYCN
jgi:AraC family ethanolamine operon transcriptional activator